MVLNNSKKHKVSEIKQTSFRFIRPRAINNKKNYLTKSRIVLEYIADHREVVRKVTILDQKGKIFHPGPYISQDAMDHLSSTQGYLYDHIGNEELRFTGTQHTVRIYVSTVPTVNGKKTKKNRELSTEGEVIIRYYTRQGHVLLKQVIARGIVGHSFSIQPYMLKREINHGITINGAYGLLTFDHLGNRITHYKADKQIAKIYVKKQSIEISMTVPQLLIDSLDHYIRNGSYPYFPDSKGPIDINRSGLVRLLLSSKGNYSTRRAYRVNNLAWAKSVHNGYFTLKTSNTDIISHKATLSYRLVCAMVNDRIPILQFHHNSDGSLGKVVNQLYPYQHALGYSD